MVKQCFLYTEICACGSKNTFSSTGSRCSEPDFSVADRMNSQLAVQFSSVQFALYRSLPNEDNDDNEDENDDDGATQRQNDPERNHVVVDIRRARCQAGRKCVRLGRIRDLGGAD